VVEGCFLARVGLLSEGEGGSRVGGDGRWAAGRREGSVGPPLKRGPWAGERGGPRPARRPADGGGATHSLLLLPLSCQLKGVLPPLLLLDLPALAQGPTDARQDEGGGVEDVPACLLHAAGVGSPAANPP